MRKKGFTLIEVIASLSIILIIFSLTFSVKNINSIMSSKIQNESVLYNVENLIIYGKAYCKKNKMTGEIQVDNKENKIIFINKYREVIKKVYLPKEIKISFSNISMKINSIGLINRGNTIGFKDNKDNFYKITVATGIDCINISKVEF